MANFLSDAFSSWGGPAKPSPGRSAPDAAAGQEEAGARSADAPAQPAAESPPPPPVAGGEEQHGSRTAAASVGEGLSGLMQKMGMARRSPAGSEADAAAAAAAVDPALLREQTDVLFGKMTEYAELELEGTSSELLLLEQMNQHTAARYAELASTAEGLGAFSSEIKEKFAKLEPVLREIDDLDAAVAELEGIVVQFDGYTKRLEAKAKALPR